MLHNIIIIMFMEKCMYGITADVRRLAYDLAKLGVQHTFSPETKMASRDWLYMASSSEIPNLRFFRSETQPELGAPAAFD